MPADAVVHVVEDEAAMRDALLLLLKSARLTPRGYSTAEAFLADEAHRQPACLVIDVRLPGMDGLALHKHLVSLGTAPATVIITGHGDIPMAVAALKAGALDFVAKPFDPALLLESVRDALRHVAESERRNELTEQVHGRLKSLTPREAAILTLLIEGHPSKVIAAKLEISIRTVEHHRAHIMEKMQARTLSQLIKMALGRHDWVAIGPSGTQATQ
jgi:two-component system, LuxR family, response regulator FixJ